MLGARIRASDLPVTEAAPLALAFITAVDGPSYRPLGVGMVLTRQGLAGSLSSGCIGADIAHHAAKVARCDVPRDLRYGVGSGFRDLELPCGGGLDIRIIPRPDADVLDRLRRALAARQPLRLWLGQRLATQPLPDACLSLQVDLRSAVRGLRQRPRGHRLCPDVRRAGARALPRPDPVPAAACASAGYRPARGSGPRPSGKG